MKGEEKKDGEWKRCRRREVEETGDDLRELKKGMKGDFVIY